MDGIVSRLLEGDSCVAISALPKADGSHRIHRVDLTGFVLRDSHFWGLSDTFMQPNRQTGETSAVVFAYSNVCEGMDPVAFTPPDFSPDSELQFRLSRSGQAAATRFVFHSDYDLLWSSSAGTDTAVLGDAIMQARGFKVAIRLDGDLWLVQRCVLPQFMKDKRYFRLSTPERRIPFFMTWDQDRLQRLLPLDGRQADLRSTTFQGGAVIFSDGQFIWFNSPATGVVRNYAELRLYVARRAASIV